MSPETDRLLSPEINASDLIKRMKAVYDCRTDRQLADRIGVKDVIFTRWRNRNTFHKEVVFAVAVDKGISLNYLLFGRPETAISADLTTAEAQVVKALCKQHGLTEAGLIRFALRLYQEVCERFANGEQIEFSGDGQNPTVLITPMLGPLRALHSPRKPPSRRR